MYAGALQLYLAQTLAKEAGGAVSSSDSEVTPSFDMFDPVRIRTAQSHFLRASVIDPGNPAAKYYLTLLQTLEDDEKGLIDQDEDDTISAEDVAHQNSPPRKRSRILT